MTYRVRVLQGAAALLYLGPLLAGLAGFGWSVVPVFAAIFLLWLVILRPQEWPTTVADWQRPEAFVGLAARGAVQLLLVTICFGIGWGIGGVTGVHPVMSVLLPIGLSFLAIPLGRLVWDPMKAQEMESFLDDALLRLQGTADAISAHTPAQRAAQRQLADRLIQPIADLSDVVPVSELEAHLRALAPHVPHILLLEALHDRAQQLPQPRSVARAYVLHATSPVVAEQCQGHAAPVKALKLATGDAELLELFARRCAALLQEDIDAWGDCPNNAALDAAQVGTSGAAARALADLMALNLRLAPLNGDGSGDAL
ncbi:hypothetical protein KM031_06470 [Gemmobacter fulvus]|uniref:Uncharacterized protein n=1 Tax=Gemmobacter fulvus TaxID=2840474 RepID=A0A975P7Y6_9RHOB|nr:hypothetical protein [Gemmobacter fulvus]MBT9244665.1 hypothetical protein [Gemmobacter fulvus]MDQ1848805.1 hypothetical protein [Gemmobacter fulvus]QWK91524.1 hypothetical protein KM031_06470 [Gemmobacter fulvus]